MDGVKVSERLRDLREHYDNGKPISTKKLEELLKERCKAKGIKGITEQTIKDYERPSKYGTTKGITKGTVIFGMRIEYLDLFADFYGVSTDYILGRSDKKTPDVNLQSACIYTGLSEKAASFLHEEKRHNPMYWRIDMVNYLLEHSTFPLLLDFLIGYAISKENKVEDVPATNGFVPIITDRDIFKSKITDFVSAITKESIGIFDGKSDYRDFYKLYYAAFFSKKFKKSGHTLQEIKREMEENGLVFFADMFQETEKPRITFDKRNKGSED